MRFLFTLNPHDILGIVIKICAKNFSRSAELLIEHFFKNLRVYSPKFLADHGAR